MAIYYSKLVHDAPEIITTAEAKNHLKVDTTDDDTLINGLIDAAILEAENYTAKSIYESKYQIQTNRWINNLVIKLSPVQTINAVKYYDDNNAEQTLDPGEYKLIQADRYTWVLHYPDTDTLPDVYERVDSVNIEVTTGYATGKTPEDIKAAIYLAIGDLYENREDKPHGLPTRSKSLLRPHRFFYGIENE